ncbi:MAG: asparaginase [Actinomycetota bacterium]
MTPPVGPLAVAVRSGFDECWHQGAAVAVDASGVVTASVGDPDLPMYARSALKPIQAAALLAKGLTLPPEELALVCASHDGSLVHQAVVVRILERYHLSVDDLQNTPTLPYGDDARATAIRGGEPPSSLQQNCSGKHAGMLATCRINGWSIDDYLDPQHPVQRAIVDYLDALGCPSQHVGIDGCGAPNHVVGLRPLAIAFGSLRANGAAPLMAMTAHPELVGGPDRDVTRWMRTVDGVATKDGAAGLMVGARPDGAAFAFKIADGSEAARQAVGGEAMRHLGVDATTVAAIATVPVRGHGAPVGTVRAVPWTATR